MQFLLKEHYIKENSEIFDFDLTKEEIDKVIKSIGETKDFIHYFWSNKKIFKI